MCKEYSTMKALCILILKSLQIIITNISKRNKHKTFALSFRIVCWVLMVNLEWSRCVHFCRYPDFQQQCCLNLNTTKSQTLFLRYQNFLSVGFIWTARGSESGRYWRHYSQLGSAQSRRHWWQNIYY